MNNSLKLGALALALTLPTGCAGSSSTASSTTQAASPAAATSAAAHSPYSHVAATGASGASLVVSTKHDKNGTVLAAGPKRLTVYLFEADRGSHSACNGACAGVWPPVTVSGAARAKGAARSAALGAITRADGSKQLTYRGHPLYFYAKDKDDGDAYGQGIESFGASWYVLSPNGSKIDES